MEARWEGPRPGATWPPGRNPSCAGPGAEPGDSFHAGAASHRGSPVAASASCRLAVTVPLHVRQKRSKSLAEGSFSTRGVHGPAPHGRPSDCVQVVCQDIVAVPKFVMADATWRPGRFRKAQAGSTVQAIPATPATSG